jgi:hypothetical protein
MVCPFSHRWLKTNEYLKAICTNCGAAFSIVHYYSLADAALATDQSDALKGILREEHVDDKFQDHLPSYDLDN